MDIVCKNVSMQTQTEGFLLLPAGSRPVYAHFASIFCCFDFSIQQSASHPALVTGDCLFHCLKLRRCDANAERHLSLVWRKSGNIPGIGWSTIIYYIYYDHSFWHHHHSPTMFWFGVLLFEGNMNVATNSFGDGVLGCRNRHLMSFVQLAVATCWPQVYEPSSPKLYPEMNQPVAGFIQRFTNCQPFEIVYFWMLLLIWTSGWFKMHSPQAFRARVQLDPICWWWQRNLEPTWPVLEHPIPKWTWHVCSVFSASKKLLSQHISSCAALYFNSTPTSTCE